MHFTRRQIALGDQFPGEIGLSRKAPHLTAVNNFYAQMLSSNLRELDKYVCFEHGLAVSTRHHYCSVLDNIACAGFTGNGLSIQTPLWLR